MTKKNRRGKHPRGNELQMVDATIDRRLPEIESPGRLIVSSGKMRYPANTVVDHNTIDLRRPGRVEKVPAGTGGQVRYSKESGFCHSAEDCALARLS